MILTRRQALYTASVSLAGLGACKFGTVSRLNRFADSLLQGDRLILSRPLKVPLDFVGIHAHRWPEGKVVSPAPTYPFGAVRSHDYGVGWNNVNKAPGVFDWARLDEWVKVHSAAKRTLIYTIYGTPQWAAAIEGKADDYGAVGAAGPPKDLSALQIFVHTLVSRYNGDGKQRLHFIETWNEPHFTGTNGQFWWGSAQELVGMGRTIYQTAKAVDPHIKILSPGFVGGLAGKLTLATPNLADAQESSVYQYLTAPDGAGNTGKRWCEGLAIHIYNASFDGPDIGYMDNIQRLKKMLSLAGLGALPIIDTEFGFLPPNPFHKKTLQEQASILRRHAAIQAALGLQGTYFYSHDDDLVGNPSIHPEIAQALADVETMLAGKTLNQVTILADNTVKVTTSDRTFTW